ncbi:MAG: thioredoxin [Candidatus Xenobia bacterium]
MIVCPNCGAENRVDTERADGGTPVCGRCKQSLNMQAPGHPVETSDGSFERDVLRSGVPTLVDFWAEWCGPCRVVGPSIEKLAKELAGRVRIVKVNVDQCPYTAQKYGIRSIPTLVMFRGLEAGRVSGALPYPDLKAFVERYAPAASA